MGEVGANSVDDPHVNLKMNGNINGNCDDEQMDVDAQNSSSETIETTNVTNKLVDNVDSVSLSDEKSNETKNKCDLVTTTTTTAKATTTETTVTAKDNEHNNMEIEEVNNENDKSSSLSHENGSNDETKPSVCDDVSNEIDLNKSSESDLIINEISADSIQNETSTSEQKIINDDECNATTTTTTTTTSATVSVAETKTDSVKKPATSSSSSENGTNAGGGGGGDDDADNLLKPLSQADDDEVHAISDSDDDAGNNENDRLHETQIKNSLDTSDDVMEIDNNSQSNGINNKTVFDDDDDKPVSIHSDSDSEHEADKDEVHEILSDKEDCVVIEDDKKTNISGNNNRGRKSAVRNFSEYDDDIEEIIEDPLEQSAAKKPRLNNDPIGKIGIESQNQFQQSNASKEPTLVIIDTNTILSRTGSTSNVHQTGGVGGGKMTNITSTMSMNDVTQNYSIDSRTSITPVPNNNQTMIGNVTSTTLAGLNAPVLTALTDDMFVLEAPSFIVPYIYEKPPSIELKEIVTKMAIEIEERKKLEELANANENATTATTTTKTDDAKLDGDDNNDGDAKEPNKSDDADDIDQKSKATSSKKRKTNKNADDSWDESDVSTDDDASDIEETKVLIKEAKADLDLIKPHIIKTDTITSSDEKKDSNNYFDSPLGKFFMDIGVNLVQEHVQTDLLRQQKRKLNREGNQASPDVQQAINSLMKNLECSKGKNDPFKFETKRCEYCNFKSESSLVMAHHYETPHMKGNLYKCNFCAFEIKPPYEILLHMKNVHNIQARLEKALSYHQCPNCLFEDNGRSKLAKHAIACSKKFRPEVNLAPPIDWDPPAKIPRIKPRHGLVGTANAYQAMAAQAQRAATAAAIQRQNLANAAAIKNRGRPQTVSKTMPTTNNNMRPQQPSIRPQVAGGIVLPNNFQMTNPGQFMQATGSKSQKNSQQPSISITAVPRQAPPNPSSNLSATNAMQQAAILPKPPGNVKPGQSPTGGKASFVICEICDGWIKDLDQLRNHMQWMHKVKIHPKMIYNRPPLNCQKCQFRFFTDQGLERHLLGSHGLVTSSMQEAANRGKDSGRCPVCGRMYQWKLLNHVSREHNMTLKPAHLSYKCTVCTATFGMYKQFENHVYSAHSTVAKRSSNDGKSKTSSSSSSTSSTTSSNVGNSSSRNSLSGIVPGAGASMLKQPFKINDEITITPQPATRTNRPIEIESHVID